MVQSKKDNLPKYFVKVGREGGITIEQRGLSYRLRWTIDGRLTTLPIGKGSDAYNIALARAREINSDLMLGRYDDTLIKYNPKKARQLAVIESQKNSLLTHWENYKVYSKATVQISTQTGNWRQVDSCLSKVKDPSLLLIENADKLMRFLLDIYSPGTVNRVFTDILSAINLAVKQDKLVKNPYTLCKETLNKLCKSTEFKGEGEFKRTRETFSSLEIEQIFQAFSNNTYCSNKSIHPHSYYLPYVKFLAFSGCRPEEAIALTKADVFSKNGMPCLKINKAHTQGVLKETKTGKPREIILNDELMDCINEGSKLYSGELIFPSVTGTYICQSNFQKRHFKKVVTGLFLEGKVSKVLPTYNLRHSRITALLADGVPPVTVAQLMGTSPEMIYSHYCGDMTESYQMPPMMKSQ